jgi:DNA-directed RNA polymerase specialized sigma24 family protein
MAVGMIDEVDRARADAALVDPPSEEAAMIRKIVGCQRDFFGDLIAPRLTPLLSTVRATIASHAEVDDIVQQTVLKAFTHVAQFRFEAGFGTWLIQIGLRGCTDRL